MPRYCKQITAWAILNITICGIIYLFFCVEQETTRYDYEYKSVKLWELPKTSTPAKYFIKYNENTTLLLPQFITQQFHDLLIIVFSHPDNFRLRDAIRRTWGSYKEINNKNITLSFLLGRANQENVQKQVYNEFLKYHDIIQVLCDDVGDNGSRKALMMLKVVYLHFQGKVQFILKTIDTVYIYLEPIIKFLPKRPRHFLAGNVQVEEIAPLCDIVSCSNICYPRYLSYTLWLMSIDSAIALFNTARKSQYYGIGDVYITGFLTEDSHIYLNDHYMFQHVAKNLDPCMLSRIVISHNVTAAEILMLHAKMVNINQYDCSRKICSSPIPQNQSSASDGAVCINPDDLEILMKPNKFCSTSIDLLIFITSAPKNVLRRNAIRETWGYIVGPRSLKIQRYFILGSPSDRNATLQKRILMEYHTYEDIIQIDFQDTYSNLTLKSLLVLNIFRTFCPNVNFLMKADDDSYVNIDYLEPVLLPRKPRTLLLGLPYVRAKRVDNTSNKWYIPKSLYKKKLYPDYLSGAGYIMSRDVAAKLYELSFTQLTFVLEDVFITGILSKLADIKLKTLKRFLMPKYSSERHPCNYSVYVLAHPVDVKEMRQIYTQIKSADWTHCLGYT